jgi:pyruvate dehydrogenase E2 component (dihydrolipoamide acetyltransferase)
MAAASIDVPLNGMRRAIARRLSESKATVPHFYLVADCRADALLELRRRMNALPGVRVSVNDLVVKAVAGALLDVPEANAVWAQTAIRRFTTVDVAVAVAVEDGILTPVLRGVETMSVAQVSAATAELVSRAKAGRLKQHELEGGSFSVSNLGMYGVREFTAIINPPQAGILAVGAATPRPVVENGELAVGTVMTVTLSADHRVIDGTVAARWMAAFVQRIEEPLLIVL